MPDLHVGILAADLTDKAGWSQYSLSMIQALHRAGIRLTVITARNSPPMDGIDVLPILPTVDPLDRGMLARMAAIYPQARAALQSCAVIHTFIEPYAPLAALVAGKRPLLITGHGSYVRAAQARPAPIRALYGWAFRRALVVCVSRYTAQIIAHTIPRVRSSVINNGVNFEHFGAIQHIGGTVPTVLSVGAVKERKGTLQLARAIAIVRDSIPNVQCHIVGTLDAEPETVQRVRETINELNLGDQVHLLGRVPDVELMRLYAAADVFALPSVNVNWKFEGYGLSLIEASAARLPVIGSRDCGAEDAIQDGITGLLIAQGELMESQLAAAIIRLLQDRAGARRMGEAGHAWAQTQTWDHAATHLIDAYRKELDPLSRHQPHPKSLSENRRGT